MTPKKNTAKNGMTKEYLNSLKIAFEITGIKLFQNGTPVTHSIPWFCINICKLSTPARFATTSPIWPILFLRLFKFYNF